MKYGSISLLALSAAAAAQPRPQHNHFHHPKRQDAVLIVTEVTTTTQAAAVVFMNQNGQAITTSYIGQADPTPAADPTSAADPTPTADPSPAADQSPAAQQDPSPSPTEIVEPSPTSPEGATQTTPTTSSTGSSTGSGTGSGDDTAAFGYGISYSPYNNDGSCKTQSQVSTDFQVFSDYGFVRSYGVDCDQATTMLTAAKGQGMTLVAGIDDISQVSSEIETLIAAAQNDWASIRAVIVGNEAVNNGMASVDAVVAAVTQARSTLRAVGFTGPVVTVDTFAQVIANPQLCEVSDFAAANAHAFFNSDLTADQAGTWVSEQAQLVKAACGGKDTVITESGWPSAGEANGLAIPSQANQEAAIASLKGAFSDNIVLFSAFNDGWKSNSASTFGAEQYWGMYGNAPA